MGFERLERRMQGSLRSHAGFVDGRSSSGHHVVLVKEKIKKARARGWSLWAIRRQDHADVDSQGVVWKVMRCRFCNHHLIFKIHPLGLSQRKAPRVHLPKALLAYIHFLSLTIGLIDKSPSRLSLPFRYRNLGLFSYYILPCWRAQGGQ